MKEKGRHLRRRITGLMLLLLFAAYSGSATLFPHVHFDDAGHRVVHSHPYTSGTASHPGHSHSHSELQLIQHLNQLVFLLSVVPALRSIGCILLNRYAVSSRIVRQADPDLPHLRGPPAFV